MLCPLCGHQFNEKQLTACKSCPISTDCCTLICCPNCGYKWTDESAIIKKLKKWFGKQEVKVEKEN